MTTTRVIKFRVSTKQREILSNLAEAEGYTTLSDYIRNRVFDQDLATHCKLNEILSLLKLNERGSKSSR